MVRTALLAAAALLASPLGAQSPAAAIPQGSLGTEGNSYHWVPVRYGPARTQTTYDAAVVGLPTGTIRRLHLRADGVRTTAFAAHAFRFTVYLSSAGIPAPASVNTQSYLANQGADRSRVLHNSRIDFPPHQNPSPTPTWVTLPISTFPYTAGNGLQVEIDTTTLSGTSEDHAWYADAVSFGSGIGAPGAFVRSGAGDACPNSGTTYGGAVGGPGEVLSIWFYSGGSSGVPAVCYLGTQTSSFLGTPLPFDLTAVGFPGCAVRTELLANIPGQTDATPGLGRYRVDVPIPADPMLAGQRLFSQNFVIDAFFPHGLAASDLGTITIGLPPTPPGAVHLYTYSATIDDTPQFASNLGLVFGVD